MNINSNDSILYKLYIGQSLVILFTGEDLDQSEVNHRNVLNDPSQAIASGTNLQDIKGKWQKKNINNKNICKRAWLMLLRICASMNIQ